MIFLTFSETSITLTAKSDKNFLRKQQTNSPVNVDVKSFKKIPANQAHRHIKTIIFHAQVGLSRECKVAYMKSTHCYHVNRQKAHFYLNRKKAL